MIHMYYFCNQKKAIKIFFTSNPYQNFFFFFGPLNFVEEILLVLGKGHQWGTRDRRRNFRALSIWELSAPATVVEL